MAVPKPQAMMESGSHVPLRWGYEAATQSFEIGEILIQNTTNQVAVASTEPLQRILGISARAATATTNSRFEYIPIIPGLLLKLAIGTSVSAGATAITDMGKLYPLGVTSNDWFVDKTDGANPCVRVVDPAIETGSGTFVAQTNGLVTVEFLHHTLECSGILHASETYDAGCIADGNEAVGELTLTEAELGDFVIGSSLEIDVADLTLVAAVTAADTVTYQLGNWTGGAIDLCSSTVQCWVQRAQGV